MEDNKNAYFLIEGGRVLEMVREHIADRLRIQAENRKIAEELRVDEGVTDRTTGVLRGVVFKDVIHPDFTKPRKNGASYPKKRTKWFSRFDGQKGYLSLPEWISKEFKIPLRVEYVGNNCRGNLAIGTIFAECGFLYLSEEGPYAMWVPDVPVAVREYEANGYTVSEPAKSFVLEFDGCRRIEKEEWEILVLQHRLANKKAA